MFLTPTSFVFFEMMLFYCLCIRRLLPILPGPNRYLTLTSQATKATSLNPILTPTSQPHVHAYRP